MKVGGVETSREALFGPLTFRRGKDYLVFYAQPVWDLDEFNLRCPAPVNNHHMFTKGGKVIDPKAPAYLDALAEHSRKRWGYIVLKTLEPSNITWDNVSLVDPSTWVNVEQDLKRSLGLYEFSRVMRLVDEANAIDEEKLEENAQSFFQQQAQAAEAKKQSPNTAPANTLSGELASVAE